jgi:hypothetical protein
MVYVPEAIEGDPHPRTSSLSNIRTNRQQKVFDVQPVQFCPGWSLENSFQSPSLPAIHRLIVSYNDTIRQEPACTFLFPGARIVTSGKTPKFPGLLVIRKAAASGDACHCCRICLGGIELGDTAGRSVGNVHP